MAKYVIGAIGSLLGALTGTWLMLAPGNPRPQARPKATLRAWKTT
jgi:hypothetical protein